MLEWYAYPIIIMGILLFFFIIAFALERKKIKLRLQAFLTRKKPYIYYDLIGADNKIHIGIAKLDDGKVNIGKNKTFTIEKSHIKLVPDYGTTGVVVSEASASSIDPAGAENTFSPETINGIIKRVKAVALGDTMKIIRYMVYILAGVGFIVLIQCFMLFKFYTALQQAGIVIAF